MTRLVFMRRTPSEIEKFGGEVFVDIDGKSTGKLGHEDLFIDVADGRHSVKMYKSHKFDTFIGFAEVSIDAKLGESLLFRYSAPMMVSQPGNIVVTDYDEREVENAFNTREANIKRDNKEDADRIQSANEKHSNGVIIVIVIVVLTAILFQMQSCMIMDGL